MIARFIRTYSVADAANVACSYRGSDPGRCRRRIVADLPRRQPHYPAQKAPPLPQDGIWAGTHRPMPGTLNNWDSPQTGSQRHECRDSLAIYRMTREDAQASRMYAHARNYQSRYLPGRSLCEISEADIKFCDTFFFLAAIRDYTSRDQRKQVPSILGIVSEQLFRCGNTKAE